MHARAGRRPSPAAAPRWGAWRPRHSVAGGQAEPLRRRSRDHEIGVGEPRARARRGVRVGLVAARRASRRRRSSSSSTSTTTRCGAELARQRDAERRQVRPQRSRRPWACDRCGELHGSPRASSAARLAPGRPPRSGRRTRSAAPRSCGSRAASPTASDVRLHHDHVPGASREPRMSRAGPGHRRRSRGRRGRRPPSSSSSRPARIASPLPSGAGASGTTSTAARSLTGCLRRYDHGSARVCGTLLLTSPTPECVA